LDGNIGAFRCESGKTTLARTLAADAYFDLENPRDLARLAQPQLALEALTGLIVIDEIQRMRVAACAVDAGRWPRSN